eukprot:6183177-Pleurochrysis_carterae.AAC.2
MPFALACTSESAPVHVRTRAVACVLTRAIACVLTRAIACALTRAIACVLTYVRDANARACVWMIRAPCVWMLLAAALHFAFSFSPAYTLQLVEYKPTGQKFAMKVINIGVTVNPPDLNNL